ncbi:MAG: hypothetical protein KBD15_00210 [Candidatus Magasanikbacteria bacterium]|jgi:hypothetical protein|nr:hypothetical protein [Candidatus Magasanikbacteria bacterium]
MIIPFSNQYQMIPKQLLRKAGYHEFVDPRTRKVSYVRTLRPSVFYPRFHAYVEMKDVGFDVNLHLDQKQASYSGTSMHAGEYEGEAVEREAARIHAVIEGMRFHL